MQAGVALNTFLDQLHSRIGGDWEPRKSQIMYDLQEASDAARQQEQQEELQQLVSEMQQQWAALQAAASSVSSSSSGSTPSSGAQTASSSAAGGTAGGAAGDTAGSTLMRSPTEESSWVLASAFDLLGMLHDAAQASGRHEPAVLDSIVQVCEAVCPGSDLHVFQALVRVSLVQQQDKAAVAESAAAEEAGAESAAADVAMQALVRALHVRYGPRVEDEDLLPKMIEATSRAANMVWL
jgi:hypothetical protein